MSRTQQQSTSFSPHHTDISEPISVQSAIKTLLFSLTVVLSLGGSILTIVYAPGAHNDKSYFEEYGIGEGDHYDDGVIMRRERNKRAPLLLVFIPMILNLVMLISLGCLGCCHGVKKGMLFVSTMLGAPAIGAAFFIGLLADRTSVPGVPIMFVGCLSVVVGNVLMAMVLAFDNTPMLKPVILQPKLPGPPPYSLILENEDRPSMGLPIVLTEDRSDAKR